MDGACGVWLPLDDCEQPGTVSRKEARNRVALTAQNFVNAVFPSKGSSHEQPEGAAVEMVQS